MDAKHDRADLQHPAVLDTRRLRHPNAGVLEGMSVEVPMVLQSGIAEEQARARIHRIQMRWGRMRVALHACRRVPKKPSSWMNEASLSIDRGACNSCGRCAEACCHDALKLVGREMSVDEVLAEVEKDRAVLQEIGWRHHDRRRRAVGAVPVHRRAPRGGPGGVSAHGDRDQWPCSRGSISKGVLRHVDLLHFDLKHMDPRKA